MSKTSVASSEDTDESESNKVRPLSDDDDDDDDDTLNGPLLPLPKSYSTKTPDKDEDDDDDDEEEESENNDKKLEEKKEETEESESDDTIDGNEVMPLKMAVKDSEEGSNDETEESVESIKEQPVRQKSKWSLSEDDDETEEKSVDILEIAGDELLPMDNEEEENSETDGSQSSLAEMIEAQIQSWYQEDGLKRPKRQSRKIYDEILQQGIDVSDLILNEEEKEKLDSEINNMKNLTLDDLIFKINFYE